MRKCTYVKSALGPLADTCGKNIEPLGSSLAGQYFGQLNSPLLSIMDCVQCSQPGRDRTSGLHRHLGVWESYIFMRWNRRSTHSASIVRCGAFMAPFQKHVPQYMTISLDKRVGFPGNTSSFPTK